MVGSFGDSRFQDGDTFSAFPDSGSGIASGSDAVMGDPSEIETAMDDIEDQCGFSTDVEAASAVDDCDGWG